MEYAKLQLVHTRHAAWKRASMAARGAAVTILAYCADQETAGVVEGAQAFSNDDWRDILGLKAAEAELAVKAGLCAWDGYHLVCQLFDHIGSTRLAVQKQQGPHGELGSEHGAKGGRPRKNNPHEKPPKGVIDDDTENPLRGLRSKKTENPPIPSIPYHTIPPTPPTPPTARETEPGPPGPGAAEGDGSGPEETDLLAVVQAAGGFLDHHKTHENLRPQWLTAIAGLAPHHVQDVFTEGPKIPAEGVIRFPDRFTRVRGILRVRLAELARQRSSAALELERQASRQAAIDAKHEADQAASGPSDRLCAHIRALDPAAVDELLTSLAAFPTCEPVIRSARLKGRITAVGLLQLTKASPELHAIAHATTSHDDLACP